MTKSFLPINERLSTPSEAGVGDHVELGDGSLDKISLVAKVARRGPYNPQTLSGHIVVNGVKASTYTTAIQQIAAHSFLRPLGALYKIFGMDFSMGLFEN